MQINKILEKIHGEINQLTPVLELFVDYSVQPGVDDCEQLQRHLTELQNHLAVYRFMKQEKELSPNFNLHAKVSENIAPEKKIEPVHEQILSDTPQVNHPVNVHPQTVTPLAIGINDKFRMINELFKQNAAEYNIAVEQLNALPSWQESEIYLNSLKMIYGWKENSEIANQLYAMTKKRFL